jgi:Phytanoyl-CoA dioxygenase (PhyH)
MDFDSPPTERFDVEIDAADVEFFAENGYLAIDRVTTDAELDWLRSVYDELISRPRTGFPDKVFDLVRPYGVTDEPKVGQLLFPEQLVPAIRRTAMWNNANRIAARLLRVAQATVENWGHLIFKTPYSAQATPWHQDEAYWSVDLAYHAVGSWLAVDAATIDNGCLWFLPGSHRGEVLRHRHLGDDPAVHVLELDEPWDTRAGVPVPLAAGGMTFHHARTMHYAGPNVTGHIRRAWANEYQTAPIKLDTPANRPWVKEGNKALSAGLARRSS